MRALLIRSSCLLSLLIASSASAVTMDWTPVGNAGNACDTQSQGCFGSVGYGYQIGTFEVTNAQYAEFLNAKAAADPFGLYDGFGYITRTGSPGSYSYSPIAGREQAPVDYVSVYDALRFANWMNNGQYSSDTETGAYTLLGPYTTSRFGTAIPSNGTTVTRNAGATIFLASEDEWYKAAYYDALSVSYFDYPAGSNESTQCSAPTATANRANCGEVVGAGPGAMTAIGSYPGSPSPYGTFDQGGNAWEWNDTIQGSSYRGLRGGAFHSNAETLASFYRSYNDPAYEDGSIGFRLVTIPGGYVVPEPSSGLLVIGGLLGLTGWRRARA